MRPFVLLAPGLPLVRLVNRRTGEHVGPDCPFCGSGNNRFHIWTEPGPHGKPANRYWCRTCEASGLTATLINSITPTIAVDIERRRIEIDRPLPTPAHIPQYRQIYELVMLWAHDWLLDETNPDPLKALAERGITAEVARRAMLGYGLNDPQSLHSYLRSIAPDLIPHAEEAGVLVTDDTGTLRTHWNLCGAIIFPTIANNQVVDLRARKLGTRQKTKSLSGSPDDRGAIFPFGWDELDGSDTVILTESGEFKALVPLAGYSAGDLTYPTLGHPGLQQFRAEWGQLLHARGVQTVILGYDSQPRKAGKDGLIRLTPEEIANIRVGLALADAGLTVRVLRLPLEAGEDKADLDAYLLRHGARALQQQADAATLLLDYHRSLPRSLLQRASLPQADQYPTRRARPRRIAPGRHDHPTPTPPNTPAMTLDAVRAQIPQLVEDHASNGEGFLVLAHPPGAGKGYGTTAGLRSYIRTDPNPGFLVWTALRKDQAADQTGIPFIELHGRNEKNCRMLPQAQILSSKGYHVRDALCERRCPARDWCAKKGYLAQFNQEGDFFAPMALLQATNWWEKADVVVLDEFDPARLLQLITLSSGDLVAMSRMRTCSPSAQQILHWINQVIAATPDSALSGALFLQAIERQAEAAGAHFGNTLAAAIDALPSEDEQRMLNKDLPWRPTHQDYQNLPPGYLARLLDQLAAEQRRRLAGEPFTSRLEARDGRLCLYLRQEHLIAALKRPEQRKVILDATVNARLLVAVFPDTPLQFEQPQILGATRVIQVVGSDWAKSTLRGAKQQTRRTRWYDLIAAQIRPGHKTLVVCTLECEAELRAALDARGHADVAIGHYGGVRGSNAYKDHDVILAQAYNPNLDVIIREGRALFAGDLIALDERVIIETRQLSDSTGRRMAVEVPTFADPRLAALLESRREAEMLQAALRGRPFDHPDTQITLMCSLPLAGLPPTILTEVPATPDSNAGRQAATQAALAAAAQQILSRGKRLLDVAVIAEAAGVSVVTVRKHWDHLAARLHLRSVQRRRVCPMPNGGERAYRRAVLIRRGRWVPATSDTIRATSVGESASGTGVMKDHACNHDLHASVIPRRRAIDPPGRRQKRRQRWRPPKGEPAQQPDLRKFPHQREEP